MDRISDGFQKCREQNRKALIPYFTAGYPTLEAGEAAIALAIDHGADIIEIGMPFSDPTADGPVIQSAGQTALANGLKTKDILNSVANLRKRYPATPFILFGYYNIFLQYGLEKLLKECYSMVDGLLIVDLPFEERDEVKDLCDDYEMALIPLIAPTTSPERARLIVDQCRGFVYTITVCGVTGARGALPADLAERLQTLKSLTPLPVVAGFGVADGRMAAAVAEHADGVVVGSAVVKVSHAPEQLIELIQDLKRGVQK